MVELVGDKSEVKGSKNNAQELTCLVILPPKSQPAPRGLTAQLSISSGSDHIRSADRLDSRLKGAEGQHIPQKAPS